MDNRPLIKIVGKDFDLQENLTEEALRQALINAFGYLIDNDFAKMIQLLYKADVDQDQLKVLLENTAHALAAEVIADAYLNRQKAKIETWQKYSPKPI